MKRLLIGCIFSMSVMFVTVICAPPAGSAEKPGWRKEWDGTVAAAKQEGKLVIYTLAGPDLRAAWRKQFKEKFGIDIEYITGQESTAITKILSERRAGLFLGDLYVGGATPLVTVLKPAGALAPIRPLLLLPEVVDKNAYFDNKFPFPDREETYVLLFGPAVANTIAINTNLVKPGEIKGYYDLLNPKWKGQIVMYDPTVTGTARNWFQATALAIGVDYHRRLVKQEPMIIRDKRLPVEWISRGKYPIALASSKEIFAEFQKVGAPIQWVPPVEGTYLSATGSLVYLGKAPHPNASKVFVNWLMTKEGLTMWSKTTLLSTSRKDVPQDFLEPEMRRDPQRKYLDNNNEEAYLKIGEYAKLAKEIYGPLLK